jgi:hypothetical protein
MRLRTFAEIQRYILLQGKLKQEEKCKWVFTAHLDSRCPIREAEGKSRWTLIEELYNTLRVMEKEMQHEKNLERLCV